MFLTGAISQELFPDTALVPGLPTLPGTPMKHEPTSACSKLARRFRSIQDSRSCAMLYTIVIFISINICLIAMNIFISVFSIEKSKYI